MAKGFSTFDDNLFESINIRIHCLNHLLESKILDGIWYYAKLRT